MQMRSGAASASGIGPILSELGKLKCTCLGNGITIRSQIRNGALPRKNRSSAFRRNDCARYAGRTVDRKWRPERINRRGNVDGCGETAATAAFVVRAVNGIYFSKAQTGEASKNARRYPFARRVNATCARRDRNTGTSRSENR